jgi:hypothetical protein
MRMIVDAASLATEHTMTDRSMASGGKFDR